MPSACDACGATGTPLAKVSLGRDFFGQVYDRLTPRSDRSPAWYCPLCSEEKRMQLDCRAIRQALEAGEGSPLEAPDARERAVARLGEIAERLQGGGFHGKLLQGPEVAELRAALGRPPAGAAR